MRLGTKSILFGAHAFWLHPWFVAWAWWKLFGFPWDPRLWLAFFVHDLGYWGKEHMDDEEGENHPFLGAAFMYRVTDEERWYNLVLYHSRFLSARDQRSPSDLCYADKLAISLTPWWLYVPMVRATGEVREYRSIEKHVEDIKKFSNDVPHPRDQSFAADKKWFNQLQGHMKQWVRENCRWANTSSCL